MAPPSCFSSMSQPGITQQREYTDLRPGDPGLTNVEGGTGEEMLVWPSRAEGLLCWNALLWAMDLGEWISCTGEVDQAKQRAW